MASLLDFDHPDSAWNRAVDNLAHSDPFCCRTEWQLSFHEAFAPHRETHVAEQNGSVISFALHKQENASPLIEPIEASWLFGSPLLGPDAIEMLADMLDAKPRATVLISGMDLNSARTRELVTTFGSRYDLLHAASETACRASLHDGLDGYLSRRSAKHRRSVRNAQRRANERGVYFQRHSPSSQIEADQVYARMLAIEARSWKGINMCGINEPPSRQFYSLMLRRMSASRCGRVMFACHDGQDIGYIFGGLCGPGAEGNVYRGQQFSFANEWRTASLGNLLQLEQLRWLCEERVARYDMGPVMDYKHHWTESLAHFDAIALRPR